MSSKPNDSGSVPLRLRQGRHSIVGVTRDRWTEGGLKMEERPISGETLRVPNLPSRSREETIQSQIGAMQRALKLSV